MDCRFGRAYEPEHRTCRSCLFHSAATCKGSVPVPKTTRKDWPATLLGQIVTMGLPEPIREHRFCERRWRFDLAWPDRFLAVEVDGAVYSQGRHTRGKGYEADLEKLNRAAALGWTVLRVSTGQVKSGKAIGMVEAMFRPGALPLDASQPLG